MALLQNIYYITLHCVNAELFKSYVGAVLLIDVRILLLKHKFDLNYISRFSSYRTVNIGYETISYYVYSSSRHLRVTQNTKPKCTL